MDRESIWTTVTAVVIGTYMRPLGLLVRPHLCNQIAHPADVVRVVGKRTHRVVGHDFAPLA